MNARTLLDNFDLIADAPGGVPKMRELILQLAVRGKLVPQDPKDEPAIRLLDRISAIKKQNRISIDIVRELPRGWEWTTLDRAGSVNPRNNVSDDIEVGFAPMAAISATYGVGPTYQRRMWGDVKKGFTHFAEGDVGMAKITPCFQNSKSAVFKGLPNGFGAGTTELHIFRPIGNTILPEFVWIWLKTPQFLSDGESKMTGSAGQKRVPTSYFADTPFPLPPLPEQKRIVAKVDELIKRCDELEARQKKRTARHKTLVASCLNAVADPKRAKTALPAILSVGISAKAEALVEVGSFNLLFSSPESITELRKTILQLAVQGRLVPCKTKYNPTSVGDHIEFLNGYAFKSEWFKPEGIRLCRNINIGHGVIDWRDAVCVTESVATELERFALKEGDVVLSLDRPLITTGLKVARIRREDMPCLLLQRVAKPVLKHRELDMAYFWLWLHSPEFTESIDPGRSNGVPHISTRQVQRLPIVLPSLAEQKRIVAKVNELMAQCDILESKLTQWDVLAEKLAVAVVGRVATNEN